VIFTKFFVRIVHVHGSVLVQHVDDRQHRLSPGRVFFPIDKHYNALAAEGIIRSPITSCSTRDHSVAAAFAENGISHEGGDGSAQCGQSVIYDCLFGVGNVCLMA